MTGFFIVGGVAGAGAALPVTDLSATNSFGTSEALGFTIATAGDYAAGRSESAAAESVGKGVERLAIAGESRAWERERAKSGA
jgi:hypothetical protein